MADARGRVGAAASAIGLATAALIVHSEGTRGFVFFLNLEALVLVVLITVLLVWSAYPLERMRDPGDGAMLAYGADAAMSAGLFGTLFGVILMLGGLEDLSEVPRRLALSFDAALFGVVLSRFILRPLAEHASRGGRRGRSP